jgi:hypothetical protein
MRSLGGEWIQLDQKRGIWLAVVNAMMNLRVLAARTSQPELNKLKCM